VQSQGRAKGCIDDSGCGLVVISKKVANQFISLQNLAGE
jgi:hypothetical protein